ncbi:Fmp23 protein [Saccharomycopsis crataegensis]|uniref:Fmp23 protein n=1 Tax=Saccharomycopsis crataegensis TaxID=43959 RepID=A0AAV5QHP1_9ASCO|nr:Fmp23 protein [Saccharomycopsis crataegensis]
MLRPRSSIVKCPPTITKRLFAASAICQGKPSDQFFGLSKPSNVGNNSPESLVIDCYKQQILKEYNFLQKISPKSTQEVYSQLPDDSQFIEQHYAELKAFKSFLDKNYKQTFSDCRSEELLEKLYKFIDGSLIESKIIIKGNAPTNNPLHLISEMNVNNIFINLDNEEVSIKSLLRFLVDVKITLNLNSNHTFILDTLLYNREIFDKVDDRIANRKKKH